MIGRGALIGLFSSVIVIVITYLVNQASGLAYPPFRLFDFMTSVLPGAFVTFGVDLMVSVIFSLQLGSTSELAKPGEQSLAILQFILLGGILGAVLGGLTDQQNLKRLHNTGLGAGLVLALAFGLIELYLGTVVGSPLPDIIWLVIAFGGWGWLVGGILHEISLARRESQETEMSRREALYLAGTGLAALVASALGLGMLFARRRSQERAAGAQPIPTPLSDAELANRIEPAPGTRPEVTPNPDFYRIDINTIPPMVDEANWQLELSGLVDNPMTLSLEDIRARPSVSQYITLTCISNRVGGDLISTSRWTGIRLVDLLNEAGLQSGAQELAIESVDGFYESVSMPDMMDPRTLLVYEMNDELLPTEHGFPLRIYIPNRYGMKQPKWITRMEVIAKEGEGYWVDRGWSEEAIVRTTSVIDNVQVEQTDGEMILSGGIAFAGERGINRVEIKIDDGSWVETELRSPPISSLTWIQWRYEAPAPETPGEHVAQVRAYDGNNELQVVEENSPHPEGATGIHSFTFRV